MYSSVNYIYEQITALVRPSKTVYIYTSDKNKLDVKPNGTDDLIDSSGKLNIAYWPNISGIVTSVNGKAGDVEITAESIGAIPSEPNGETPLIDTNGKIDGSYLPKVGGTVKSVNGIDADENGNIILGPDDVGAVPYEPLPDKPLIDDSNDKINSVYLPDYILGQVLFGGTVSQVEIGPGVFETHIYVSDSLASKNNLVTGTIYPILEDSYGNYEGVYFIANHRFTFDNKTFETGDWLISSGSSWQKIDNTDAVQSVNGKTGAVVLTPANIGAIPNKPNGETLLIDTNGKIDSGYLPEKITSDKTIESQMLLKNGGESDNKFGAISSISSDGSTTYLLRPYKNGAELHVVIGNSDATPEIITKSRPIVKIGDAYDYMATKGDIKKLTPADIGAIPKIEEYPPSTSTKDFRVYCNDNNGNVIVKIAGEQQRANQIQMSDNYGRLLFASAFATKGFSEFCGLQAKDIQIVPQYITLTAEQQASWQSWLGVGGGVEWVANTATALTDVSEENILALEVNIMPAYDEEWNGVTIVKIIPNIGDYAERIFDGMSNFTDVLFGVYRVEAIFEGSINIYTATADTNGANISISRVLIKK